MRTHAELQPWFEACRGKISPCLKLSIPQLGKGQGRRGRGRKLGWSELEIRVTVLGFVFKLGDGPIWFRTQKVQKIYVQGTESIASVLATYSPSSQEAPKVSYLCIIPEIFYAQATK